MAWDKAGYHSSTFIVYWYIEGNTDLNKGDVIVIDAGIETFMKDYTCSSMKNSTWIGISGASHHRNGADIPVDSKMLMFMLCTINRILYYKLNRKFSNE